jgi:aminoglycoside phosphotransferase family enzyme/predicted kinase
VSENEQEDVVAFLAAPVTHGGATVERISTHSAHIFLAGDRAYKLKRAVKLTFLDFSSAEKRRAALETELALNRRIAPHLYLSILPISRRPTGVLGFGGDDPVDWVLVMQRFPQRHLLDVMATEGSLTRPIIDKLADAVVSMHRGADIVRASTIPSFKTIAFDTVSELRNTALDDLAICELERDLHTAFAKLGRHLNARTSDGFVRRLHGDLHLGNIVLLDGQPTPFDALEFDAAFATGDVYYDLAFLLMDLDHRDLRPLANHLLNRYLALTDDIGGLLGLPLFMAIRAAIRAKVLAISARLAEATQYLAMAKKYLPADAPCIIGIGGLSGTGKSSLALELAPRQTPSPGAIVIRSDVVRKRMHGVAETARLNRDDYTPAAAAQVYTLSLERARRVVTAGYTVIVDAVFSSQPEREALAKLADELKVPFHGLWLEADLETRLARVAARAADASDADATIVKAQAAYNLGDISWVRCDAGKNIAAVATDAVHILREDAVKAKA